MARQGAPSDWVHGTRASINTRGLEWADIGEERKLARGTLIMRALPCHGWWWTSDAEEVADEAG